MERTKVRTTERAKERAKEGRTDETKKETTEGTATEVTEATCLVSKIETNLKRKMTMKENLKNKQMKSSRRKSTLLEYRH